MLSCKLRLNRNLQQNPIFPIPRLFHRSTDRSIDRVTGGFLKAQSFLTFSQSNRIIFLFFESK